ncbi:hypothetical protein GGR92_000883 [Spirosoma lacussanchae]
MTRVQEDNSLAISPRGRWVQIHKVRKGQPSGDNLNAPIRQVWTFGTASPYQNQNFNKVDNQKMEITAEHNERIAKLTFASVYPHYVTKAERKGRTKEELHQVIEWLTGFDERKVQELIDEKATFETFFKKAKLNPNANLIKGVICGYRIEEIENSLTRQVRYLDKLVDELAKGKKVEKILRTT